MLSGLSVRASCFKKDGHVGRLVAQSVKHLTSAQVTISRHDLMVREFEPYIGLHADSTLIGSNIARQSRYELIHTTLVKFLKTCTLDRKSVV